MNRILFVHPDQKLSQIYTRHMGQYFQIDSAFDGLAALRRLKLSRPNLVVSDYQLPLLSGISLLKFMRNNETYRALPFIFLTDHHDNSDALSFGANDWLEARATHPELLIEKIYQHIKINKHALQIR